MAYSIKLIEITDPFAEDFGLVVTDKVLLQPVSLAELLAEQYPDTVRYAYVNMVEVKLSTVLVAGNVVLVADEVGKSGLKIVAGLAIMALAWHFAPIGITAMFGETAAYTATGAWTMTTMIAFTAMNMVGNILINALLAPDLPDTSSTGMDKSKAYLWTGARNQSTQMIPIPVVLGTFQIAGNLINVYTETNKVSSSGISIRETIYMLYGLTSNELHEITECKINDMDADTFAETDRSIYYTKGLGTQYPYDTNATNAQYPSNPNVNVALYGDETAAPANGGVLFPNLIEEIVCNKLIEIPYHNFAESSSAISVFADGVSQGIYANLDQAVFAGATGNIALRHDADVTIPATGTIKISCPKTTLNVNISFLHYTGITIVDSEHTILTGITRDEANFAFFPGAIVEFFTAETKQLKNVTGLSYDPLGPWDIWTQQLRPSYTTQNLQTSTLDDIKIQIVFDRGLYTMGNTTGNKFEIVMGFNFSIEAGSITETLVLPDISYSKMSEREKKYCIRAKNTSTFFHEFNFVEILKDAEIINNFSSVFLDATKTTLVNHTYTVGIKIATTQNNTKHNGSTNWCVFAEDPTAENSPGTDFYDCHFSRVEALSYGTILNYPNTSTLGLVLNATPVINNQLPKVTVVASGEFYYYVAGVDIKAKVSTWTRGVCSNPAYLVINMLYNDFWGAKIGGLLTSPTKDAEFAALVDIDKYVDLANWCATSVTIDNAGNTGNRYTFNGLIDTEMSIWEAITMVLKAANATPIFDGKKISVYWDEIQFDSIIQLFTTSTIKEGSFTESFLGEDQLAECVSGNFIDSGDNYNKNSIIYLPAGADAAKKIDIELYGIVDAARAMRALKEKLKKTQTLRQIFKFTTSDSSAVSCEIGDKIGIQYEFIDFSSNDNSISGRLKGVSGTIIVLDKIIPEITTTPTLIVRTNDNKIHSVSITNWNNTGEVTILSVSSTITDSVALDPYLVGSTANFYKEALVTAIDINENLSATIEAINYDASIYTAFYGVVVNSVTNPNIVQADVTVKNLKAIYIPHTGVIVNWDAPNFATSLPVDYYMVYKKTNDSVAIYVGKVTTTTYTDDEFAINEILYYKVLPVIIYRGTPITIPLGWASYSNAIDLTSGLLEYMEAPPYTLAATLTPGQIGCVDLTVNITDPGGWIFKDRREGFTIWTRFSDSLTMDDWFGPTDIVLTDTATANGQFVKVNTIAGLPTLGGVVCCLLLIDNCDLVAVIGNTGTTLNVMQWGFDSNGYSNAGRKFALSKTHAAGKPVYIANKGFFPVKYFGLEESCTAYGANNQITCTNILSYDAVTNTMTSGSFDTEFMNSTKVGAAYVDGNSSQITGIASFTANSMILADARPASDFAVHLLGQDITGNHFGLYEMYWQDDSAYKTFAFDLDSNNIYGTIQAIPMASKYVWVAVNRILYAIDPTKEKVVSAWISNPRIYV